MLALLDPDLAAAFIASLRVIGRLLHGLVDRAAPDVVGQVSVHVPYEDGVRVAYDVLRHSRYRLVPRVPGFPWA